MVNYPTQTLSAGEGDDDIATTTKGDEAKEEQEGKGTIQLT